MHILDIEIGQTVKLNRSPSYGEASDYLHRGMTGIVEEIDRQECAIAVKSQIARWLFARTTLTRCCIDMRYLAYGCWICCGGALINASAYMKDGDHWMGFLCCILTVVNWRMGHSLYVPKQNLKGE